MILKDLILGTLPRSPRRQTAASPPCPKGRTAAMMPSAKHWYPGIVDRMKIY